MTWNSNHLFLLRSIWVLFLVTAGFTHASTVIEFWLCWSWLESLTCWGLAIYWLSVFWFGIVLVLLHVFPTSLCKAGPALPRQKKGRAVEKAEACETMHYSTHTWEASLLPYSMLAVKARVRPVQMSRLKNRFYLLRRAPLKSYYRDHGHKERSRAATIFAEDRPNIGIYFFNTIPCYFMKLSQ